MRARRNGRLRRFTTIAVAVVSGVVCAMAIAITLPPDAPRRVIVAESANINPLPTTIGFADSDIYGLSPADVERTLGLMGSTDVRTIRLMIPWAGVEPFQGTLDWSTVDKTVDAAAARSCRSSASSTRPRPGRWRRRTADQRKAGVAGGIRRLRREGGDPLLGQSRRRTRSGTSRTVRLLSPHPDPAGYTDLLKAAYPKIKAVDPTVDRGHRRRAGIRYRLRRE